MQRELNQRGYEAGQPDGVAGLVTRAAIMAYEHDFGLPVTATPGQDLLSRIVLGSSAPSGAQRVTADQQASGEAESVTRSVKQQLMALGYTPGKADGQADEQTGARDPRIRSRSEAARKRPHFRSFGQPLDPPAGAEHASAGRQDSRCPASQTRIRRKTKARAR